MKDKYEPKLQKAIDFHGHFCPGLAIGYRAAKAALEILEVERAEDEELIAIVENDACGIDAIQSLLGCTIGKGNLIFKDYGKQVFTIGCRKRNKAVRIAMKNEPYSQPAPENLRSAMLSGTANEEQLQAWHKFQQQRIAELLSMDVNQLFKIEMVNIPLPRPAKIFPSVICEECGEKTMEPRARIKGGKVVCPSCYEEYSRGW